MSIMLRWTCYLYVICTYFQRDRFSIYMFLYMWWYLQNTKFNYYSCVHKNSEFYQIENSWNCTIITCTCILHVLSKGSLFTLHVFICVVISPQHKTELLFLFTQNIDLSNSEFYKITNSWNSTVIKCIPLHVLCTYFQRDRFSLYTFLNILISTNHTHDKA
jgi:hypothetical protein